jgi:S-DNA-T family DNA segregation ATPase FtsK/SpoIIIE
VAVSSAPPFPFVATIAPVIIGVAMWAMWGTPFALVGAVIGPVMVVAHFADSLRRHRAQSLREAREVRLTAVAQERESRAALTSIRDDENRRFPSIASIVTSPGWIPALDGSTLVRAGSHSREGIPGFPWLLDATSGISVLGSGPVADAVLRSIVVGLSTRLGPATTVTSQSWEWPRGIRLSRGDDPLCALSIRCTSTAIETVSRRGELPAVVDAVADNTDGWELVLARCGSGETVIDWDDRSVCSVGVGIDSSGSLVLDLTSQSPHVAIAGRTGSGKSEFIAALVSDWAERFEPDQLSWVGFDFKGGATLTPLGTLLNCRGVDTDLDVASAKRVWRAIATELVRRESLLAKEGVAQIEGSRQMTRLAVVIDEFPELVRLIPGVTETIGAIARRGRSLGMHLVIATQNVSALSRDGLLANLTTRVCFPLGATHDVTVFLGTTPIHEPRVGQPVVGFPDGSVRLVRVRRGAARGSVEQVHGERLPPLAGRQPVPPVWGTDGFGLIDDPDALTARVAQWSPEDGDLVVLGRRGSGRTTALSALTDALGATWVRSPHDLVLPNDVVVIDDLDSLVSGLTDIERLELTSMIESRRLSNPATTFVFATTKWLPRIHGTVRNVLTLSTNARDEHVVTGEPADTYDVDAPPGVGSWKGKRVVIYARTDSLVTDEIP